MEKDQHSFAPSPFISWSENLEEDQTIEIKQGEIFLKLSVTAEGFTIIATAEQVEAAQEFIRKMGFKTAQPVKVLCG